MLVALVGLAMVVATVATAVLDDPAPASSGPGLVVLVAIVAMPVAWILMTWRSLADVEPGPVDIAALAVAVLTGSVLRLVSAADNAPGLIVAWFAIVAAGARLRVRTALAFAVAALAVVDVAAGWRSAVDGEPPLQILILAVTYDLAALFTLALPLAVRAYLLRRQDAESLVAQLESAGEAKSQAAALRERSTIARDLHDALGHSLTVLTLRLDAVRARVRRRDPQVAAELDEVRRLAGQGLEDARQAVRTLRSMPPPGPDRLVAMIDDFQHGTGIGVRLQVDGASRELSADAALALYRAAQEGLTNVARHSAATQVDVLLRYGEGDVRLVVQDRGGDVGPGSAAPAAGVDERWTPGAGLRGLGDRAHELGGELRAGPIPGGFRVDVTLPLPGG